MANTDLKHLGFVTSYASYGYDYITSHKYAAKAVSVYNSAKEKSVLKAGLEKLEGAVACYGKPIVTKAYEVAPAYLARADDKLDKAMTVAFSYYTESVLPSKPVQAAKAVKDAFYAKHPENLELFKKARDEYFALIETSIETLKARGVSLSEDAVKAVTLALDRARAQASAAIPTQKMVFDKASHAWETIAAQPAVAASLEKALPKITVAKKKANDLLAAVQEHKHYKAYAEPTISHVTSSPYFIKIVDYVKPLVAGPAK